MEAQPQPPAAPPPQQQPQHLNYPDSVDSSPRSRNTDSWDDQPLPPSSAATKLRLMCSYGGHIVPRPHDKTLCYAGGDTRIVVVDRHTSLSDLSTRLSKTLLDGRTFTLKYQLPNEDLDSLISVTTDEDLDNMIDEHDHRTANSVKPNRIRLFLFPDPVGPVVLDPSNSAKSEDWFLDALNGAGSMERGFSESGGSSVNCLLGLDDEVAGNNLEPGSRDVGSFGNGKGLKQDFQSVPDSPMLETNSSFGSTSSSPSVANLPPIRVAVDDGGGVRVQDQKVVGIEEQFGQMGVGGVGQKQDEGSVVMSSPPVAAAVGVPIASAAVAGEYPNRVFSDDERSDHGVPVGYRKPTTQQAQAQAQAQTQTQAQTQYQFQQKSTGVVDLPSPDSVSSDSSLSNAMSRQKTVSYQDQVQIQSGTTRVPSNSVDPKLNVYDPRGRIQMQQHGQDPGYVLQQQFDQQQQHQQQLDQQQQQQHVQDPRYVLQQQFDQQQQQQPHQQQLDQQQPQQLDQQQPQQHVQDPRYVLQQQFDQQQQHQQQQLDQQKQQHVQDPRYVLQQQFDQQQQQQQQQQHVQDHRYVLQQQFDQQQQHQQHVQDPGYVLQQQFEQQQQPQQQQQFMHGTHFIHRTPAGAVPVPAYYPVYPSQQQQHPQHHHQLDQQYPVYYVPARQPQAYNLSMQQANIGESATTIPSSRPQTPPNPAAYNPVRNASLPKSEMTAGAYRTATAGTPQLVQVPTSQHQQQYVAYSQIHHPSQSLAPNSAAPANYAYDYADPAHAQMLYSQLLAPPMPSQYQTMTSAAVVLPEVSSQLPSDSMKQQVRTSQPL